MQRYFSIERSQYVKAHWFGMYRLEVDWIKELIKAKKVSINLGPSWKRTTADVTTASGVKTMYIGNFLVEYSDNTLDVFEEQAFHKAFQESHVNSSYGNHLDEY